LANTFEKTYQEAVAKPKPGIMVQLAKDLRKWKNIAEITGEDQTQLFKDREENLTKLWQSLGFSRDGEGRVKRSKATAKLQLSTADELAMQKAYEAYLELFFPANDDICEALAEELQVNQSFEPGVTEQQDEQVLDLGNEDIGVTQFLKQDLVEMQRLLGLKDRFPLGEGGVKDSNGHVLKERIDPRRHQYVGVAATLLRMFVDEVGSPGLPTLLCDDVGLGKTLQIIGVISMLVHIIELQSRNEPLPPLLQEQNKIYFNGQEKITPRPFLLLMSPGLVTQWAQQIQKFTTHGAFRVLIYSSKTKATFFSPGGPWEEKVTKVKDPHRTIIIATFTAVASEVASCLTDTTHSTALVAEARPESIIQPAGPGRRDTIFEKSFLMTAIDEIHSLRNVNKQYRGALRLTCNSDIAMGATATPVFNGVKDLLSSARLLRILEAIGDNGVVLTTRMIQSERRRDDKWSSKEGNTSFASHLAEYHRSHKRGALDQQKLMRKAYVCKEAIEMTKSVLLPAVVRRTGKSKDPDGSSILSLRAYSESIAWTFLSPTEYEILEEFLQPQKDNDPHDKHDKKKAKQDPKNQPYSKAVSLRDFLVKFKHMSFHIRFHNEDGFWESWTLDNWESQASSKILMVVSIIKHHRDPGAGPMFWSHETGARDKDLEEKAVWTPASRKRKILLMCVYEKPRAILKLVFGFIGVRCLEYDGSLTMSARQSVIQEFETNEEVDILMISNVGTTGLNITRASIVVFVSGLWSNPEEQQTIGRVWRMGQLEDVFVYRVVARNTPDEILLGFANGKQVMLWQFVGKSRARQLLHSGGEGSDESDHEEDDSELILRRTKAQARLQQRLPRAPRKKTGTKQTTAPKKRQVAQPKDDTNDALEAPPSDNDPPPNTLKKPITRRGRAQNKFDSESGLKPSKKRSTPDVNSDVNHTPKDGVPPKQIKKRKTCTSDGATIQPSPANPLGPASTTTSSSALPSTSSVKEVTVGDQGNDQIGTLS
ncbi:hypothetical protein FRC11_002417, partial [Ceratobasidium sp. 423]